MGNRNVGSTSFEKSISIEVTANRLLIRSLIVLLVASDPEKAVTTVKALLAAIDAMVESNVFAKEYDPAVHQAAVALVRSRASKFIKELGYSAALQNLKHTEAA